MLRNLGIRSKLLAVLAVPLAVLVALSTFVIHQGFTETMAAQRVESLTAMTGQVNSLVHALQRERSLSATLLYGGPNATVKADLAKARTATDHALRLVRAAEAAAPISESTPELADAVKQASDRHDQIEVTRRAIDAGGYGAIDAHLDFYTYAIALDLGLTNHVAAMTDDAELARNLRAFSQLGEVVDASWQERDILVRAFDEHTLAVPGFAEAAGFAATQDRGLSAYADSATPAQMKRMQAAFRTIDTGTIAAAHQAAAELVTKGDTRVPTAWAEVADARIGALTALEGPMIVDLAKRAAAVVDSARQKAMLTAFATLFGAFAALGLALVLARRLVGPIRRLTVAATLTAERLPGMVDRMQEPGARPDIDLEHIPVDSTDEIGQLAAAFNVVNDVTVKVAHDQAALRSSIAEMFVNVARRNQVLLSRQLNYIDDMEAREENADTLENLFRIDHLATRMRRNAESLLVLAGIDANRRLRTSMPLTDVIRSAISEIESFDRVDLAASVDAPLTGRVAMTAAHLLAEIIENATHFSNPDTRVVVATGPSKTGIEVTITDYGLGMSQDDIDDANDKIANPPIGDIAIAQRLGFFVVGRLAQRLEATVRLRRGRSTGTVVSVLLPAALFDPDSLPHVVPTGASSEVASNDEIAPGVPVVPDPVTAPELADPVTSHDSVATKPAPAPLVPPVVAAEPSPPGSGLLPRRRRRRGGDVEPTATPAPEPEPAATPEPEPAVALTPVPEPFVAATPTPEPIVAPTPVPEPESVVATPALPPETAPAHADGRTVAAALHDLATAVPAPEPAPVAAEEATSDAGRSPAPLEMSVPSTGQPSLDVLPGRHRAKAKRTLGLFRRAGREPETAQSLLPTSSLPRRTVIESREQTPAPARDPLPKAQPVTSARSVAGSGYDGATPPHFAAPVSAPDSSGPSPTGSTAATLFGRQLPPSPFARRVRQPESVAAAAASEPLPLTRPQPSSGGAEDAGSARGGDDFMATRSALASQALSELSRLNSSSYTPAAVVAERPAPLTRRVPRSGASPVVEEAPETSTRRVRSAEEVRSRLSGFRAGVERGRDDTAQSASAAPTAAAESTSTGPTATATATATKQMRKSTTKEEKR